VLPADGEVPYIGPSGAPDPVPRSISDPNDEYLISKLDDLRRDIKSILPNFFIKRPKQEVVGLLVEQMSVLFYQVDEIVNTPQTPKRGRKVNFDRIRVALREAAIATSLLLGRDASTDELADMHERLLKLCRLLDDIVQA
jgi:hypothetical protein